MPVLVKNEINTLLQRAKEFLLLNKDETVLVKYFYRNKPAEYYDNINRNRKGIMEPYLKDYNGDQGSVINGVINGLFFSTKVDAKTGMPPSLSPFGNMRLNIPVDRLMHTQCKIYFADFYCNHSVHYVTLVVTENGSDTDRFCKENLIDIGLFHRKNPFLYYEPNLDLFFCCTKLWVEVLYTEEIDIWKALAEDSRVFFSYVKTLGKGSSSPLGLPKNDKCYTCNIYLDDRDKEF